MSYLFFFFFSSRRRHTRSLRDWSSDVCSSDLELGEALRLPVDQGRHPELLREAPQLAERRGTLVQVHEMTFDAPFGKEPEGGARVGALSDPEDLDFHS